MILLDFVTDSESPSLGRRIIILEWTGNGDVANFWLAAITTRDEWSIHARSTHLR